MVRFLALTGLRFGEAAALRVSRVDVLRRRVEVVEAVAEVAGRLEWGTPKTHQRRTVPLARRCEGKGPEELLLTAPRGGPLRLRNFRVRFDRAARAVGIADVSPHDLRHTAASPAVAAGANVKHVQRMLGHASAAMTLDVYAALFEDDLDAVAAHMDGPSDADADSARTQRGLSAD